MPPIVECVPNFSEGRRADVIAAIVDAARRSGVRVLDVHSDPDHNRTVVTMVGDPGRVEEAACAAAATAARLIDMETHEGVHPCIGAVDVIPFVPVRDVAMADCVEIARRVGSRLAE
jgi:glutamate formiminotransferase